MIVVGKVSPRSIRIHVKLRLVPVEDLTELTNFYDY
jgi:hypothetical protein